MSHDFSSLLIVHQTQILSDIKPYLCYIKLCFLGSVLVYFICKKEKSRGCMFNHSNKLEKFEQPKLSWFSLKKNLNSLHFLK